MRSLSTWIRPTTRISSFYDPTYLLKSGCVPFSLKHPERLMN
jgi:hypothetical protein